MARTHRKVRYSPSSKGSKHTPATAATGVEQAFKFLEGRWKLVILFHLFGGKMLRFSELERAIPRDLSEDADPAASTIRARQHCPADRPPSSAAEGGVWPHGLGTGAMSRSRCAADLGRGARQAIKHETQSSGSGLRKQG